MPSTALVGAVECAWRARYRRERSRANFLRDGLVAWLAAQGMRQGGYDHALAFVTAQSFFDSKRIERQVDHRSPQLPVLLLDESQQTDGLTVRIVTPGFCIAVFVASQRR